jgi:hypothetical protein
VQGSSNPYEMGVDARKLIWHGMATLNWITWRHRAPPGCGRGAPPQCRPRWIACKGGANFITRDSPQGGTSGETYPMISAHSQRRSGVHGSSNMHRTGDLEAVL